MTAERWLCLHCGAERCAEEIAAAALVGCGVQVPLTANTSRYVRVATCDAEPIYCAPGPGSRIRDRRCTLPMTFWERVEQKILSLRQHDSFTLGALGDARHAQHVRLAEPDEEAYLVSANTHREALEKVDRTGAQVYPAVDGWRGHAEARPLTAEELIILRAATGAPRLPPKAVA